MLEKIKESAEYIASKVKDMPKTAVILGTGLGELVNHIEITETIPYSEIPNFPVSTVEGHSGKMIFGRLGSKRIMAMQGRFHFYEGYTAPEIGKLLKKNTNTVYTLLRRAKEILKVSLGGELNG